jgi:hypothetical protein
MNPGHPGQPRQPDRPQFFVTLQPADDVVPDGVRLRRLLKALGRQHGLRVLDVAERPEVMDVSPVDPVRDK